MKHLRILMIDDHPMILEGYKNALTEGEELSFQIDTAHDCDTAIVKINASSVEPYGLIFLDIRMAPCSNGRHLSGEDIGIYIREKFPQSKIIVLTMFNRNVRLQNILKNLNPEALLIKDEVTPTVLRQAVKIVLQGGNFYSDGVQTLPVHDSSLDDYDRKILYYLSKGTKTKELVDFVPLSLGAIEKRKRKIKEVFGISGRGDKEILDKAEELGFL